MPSWTPSLFFHFSFWKDEFLHLFLILFLSHSCQKNQTRFASDSSLFPWGEPATQLKYTTLCLLPPLKAIQAAAGRELDVSLPLTDGAGGAIRPPHYQSDLYARSEAAAVPEPGERAAQQLFYLQPADNGVEIDRSCRQQVTPCLSAPNGSSCTYSTGQERFNSFCLSLGFTGVLRGSTTLLFMPALRWCSPTDFSWVASDSEQWERTRTSHIYIITVHVCVGQIPYLHTLCSARCQYRARLNNLILLR